MESTGQTVSIDEDRTITTDADSRVKREEMHSMEEYIFSKYGSKLDIMDLVMKRRLGGSSDEDSPVKKRKTNEDSPVKKSKTDEESPVKMRKTDEDSPVKNSKTDEESPVKKRKTDEDSPVKKRKADQSNEYPNSSGSESGNHTGKSDLGFDSKVGTKFHQGINDSVDLNRQHRQSHTNEGNLMNHELVASKSKVDELAHSIGENDSNLQSLNQAEKQLNMPHTPNLDTRSDKSMPYSFTSSSKYTCRSEPVSLFTKRNLECESLNIGNTVVTETGPKQTKWISEIRLKIPATVYKTELNNDKDKRRTISRDDIESIATSDDVDETDGDASSVVTSQVYKDLGSRAGDKTSSGGTTSSHFQTHSEQGSKKSRKQFMPKRIVKHCMKQGSEQVTAKSERGVEDKSLSKTSEKVSDEFHSVSSISQSSVKREMEPTGICNSNNINNMQGYENHEKSRKQSMPKKIVDHAVSFNHTVSHNREENNKNKETIQAMENMKRFDRNLDDSGTKGEKTIKQFVTQKGKADERIEMVTDTVHDKKGRTQIFPPNDGLQTSFGSKDNKHVVNIRSEPNNMNNCASPYIPNVNLGIPESYLTPELARLSQQIAEQAELLAKLSQSRIQMTENLSSDKEQPVNESLEFVRKLREIRFNRYRKIAISEKKHIASFAKIHGISAAANYFGVSKSAVSLWTRTDFKETDEELARKKRNCLIGNEKFEKLVERVRQSKAVKFKNLSKEDKVEVVKYAKLVGVREMSRCLDIALGTVSGWMRQFPYDIKKRTEENIQVESSNTSSQDSSDIPCKIETDMNISCKYGADTKTEEGLDAICKIDNKKEANCLKGDFTEIKKPNHETSSDANLLEKHDKKDISSDFKRTTVKMEPCENLGMEEDKAKKEEKDRSAAASYTSEREVLENIVNDSLPVSVMKYSHVKEFCEVDTDSKIGNRETETTENDVGQKPLLDVETDLENMIADSFVKLDVERCFDDIKEQIIGTVLDGDEYFEHLFKRVTETRVDKYKTLKASEKLEVVRYAKRIGVRRVAKIMDLATGTLSGWIIKYQHLLGLVSNSDAENGSYSFSNSSVELDQSLNSTVAVETGVSQITESPSATSETSIDSSPYYTERPSSILDNVEKTEVTALKFLLKDRFPLLLEKIDIARKVKFKNLIPAEKIEIVKCAKLVGIRPTARVFQMPLGTLSGWISKYSCLLEPEFQGDGQSSANPNSYSEASVDNSVDSLNESELSTSAPLKVAPHLHWVANQRSDWNERLESPYSKMMNEMAEKSFSNVNNFYPPNFEINGFNSKTNILNRRLSVEWPKVDVNAGEDEPESQPEMSWPKVKLPNGAKESIKVPNSDVSFPNFLLHGHGNVLQHDETTKAMAQKYLQQFGMVQFADST